MSYEQMITDAVLRDNFTPMLRKIAAAQDEYARRTMVLNTAANLALGVGGAGAAFLVQSVRVAGQLDLIHKSLTKVEGANKAAFDMSYADNYAKQSMQTYMTLEEVAGRMGLRHLQVSKYLSTAADIAAASRRPIEEVADLLMRIQSNSMGYPLGARGLPRMGISTQSVFAAAGLPYTPGGKIQGSITPEQALEAIRKVVQQNNWKGLDKAMARTTLKGSTSMVVDAISRIEATVGKANLQPTVEALDHIADSLNKIADFAKAHPSITFDIEGATAIALVYGGVMKGIVAWRNYKAMIAAVQTVAAAERTTEVQKIATATQEATAIETSAAKYTALSTEVRGAGKSYDALATSEQVAGDGAIVAMGKFERLAGVLGTVAKLARSLFIFTEIFNALNDLNSGPDQIAFNAGKSEFDPNVLRGTKNLFDHPLSLVYTFQHALSSSESDFDRYAGASWRLVGASKDLQEKAAFEKLMPEINKIEQNWGAATKSEVYRVGRQIAAIVDKAQATLPGMPSAASDSSGQGGSSAPSGPDMFSWEFAAKQAQTYFDIAKMGFGQKHDHNDFKDMLRFSALTEKAMKSEIVALEAHARAIANDASKRSEWLSTMDKVLQAKQKMAEVDKDVADAKLYNPQLIQYEADQDRFQTLYNIAKRAHEHHPMNLGSLHDMQINAQGFLANAAMEEAALTKQADAIKKAHGYTQQWLDTMHKLDELQQKMADFKYDLGQMKAHDLVTAILGAQGIDEAWLAKHGISQLALSHLSKGDLSKYELPGILAYMKAMAARKDAHGHPIPFPYTGFDYHNPTGQPAFPKDWAGAGAPPSKVTDPVAAAHAAMAQKLAAPAKHPVVIHLHQTLELDGNTMAKWENKIETNVENKVVREIIRMSETSSSADFGRW